MLVLVPEIGRFADMLRIADRGEQVATLSALLFKRAPIAVGVSRVLKRADRSADIERIVNPRRFGGHDSSHCDAVALC